MEAFEPVSQQHLSPDRPKPSTKQKFLMGLRAIFSTFTTISINFLIFVVKLLRPLLGRKFYRRLCDNLQLVWFNTAFALLGKPRLHVYGQYKQLHNMKDDIRPRIVIANHATDVDWLYLWMLAHTCETPRTGNVKVMLKEGVKKIPLYGWLLDNLDSLWMKRNWESDREAIHATIRKLCSDGEPLWLVMFPEGMTVNEKSLEKSHNFAKDEGRPMLNLTLLPRDKGLSAIIESTKDLDPEIIDVTIAFQSYTGEIPTWEMGYERNRDHLVPNAKKVLAGMSGDVYMDVRTIDASSALAHPLGIKGWLDERWVRKESLLKHFILHESFPHDDHTDCETKIAAGSFLGAWSVMLTDLAIIAALKRVGSSLWSIAKAKAQGM